MTTSYLDTRQFNTYVAAMAARSGISVVWDDPSSTPRTDGKTVYLPRITSTTSDEVITKLRYFIKHESSHCKYTDFDYFVKKGPQGLLQFIINLLEDNRVDWSNDDEYRGDRDLSSEFYELFIRDTEARLADASISEEQQMVLPLFVWDGHYREFVRGAIGLSGVLEKGLSSDSYVRYSKLMSGTYGERLVALRTSKAGANDDLLDLAEDILRDIYEQDPEAYKKPGKGDEKTEGEGEGEGENEGDDEGEGEGEGGKKPGKGEAEDGEGKGKTTVTKGDDVDRLITVEKMSKAMGEHIISRTGVHWKHKVGRGAYTLPSSDDYHVLRFPLSAKDIDAVGARGSWSMFDKDDVTEEVNTHSKPLANKLRMKLQVRAAGKWENNKKRGHIHGGSLHKLVTAKGTEQEGRVFRKHIVSDTLDTAVDLLVDCSGSMSGAKFETACAGAAALALALRPLHIAHAVHGFTNTPRNDDPVIWVFNEWGEHVPLPELVRRFSVASTALHENTDGDAIAWCAAHLTPRREHRKILIVLSDGSPAGRCWAGSISAYTKQVIETIEARKQIEIYGIGIQDDNVERYYKNHVVINRMQDLSDSILSIIDKSL